MCGICGIFEYTDNFRKVDATLLKNMADRIKHRGPDGEGFHVEENMGLGHRRLAIIDLAGGIQPMANEDGSIFIVYNGEIYNFRTLAGELQALGHTFRTSSDTEVIVHGYEQWGKKVVDRLVGMFSFAIWDRKKKRLFCARDRLGIKPFVYATENGRFIFASEIKALLPAINKPSVDFSKIPLYLVFGYIPHPFTIYRGIMKLPPAHTLTVDSNGIFLEEYWDVSGRVSGSDSDTTKTENAVEKLRELLEEAVRIRLVSDVPLGAFLSGGIDSSSIVHFMRKASTSPPRTFTIGFREEDFSELEWARLIARKENTLHTEEIVEPAGLSALPELIYYYDEPFADSSALPTYQLSKITRKYVTVALAGDGSDEVFGGYQRYQEELKDEIFDLLPASARRLLAELAARFFKHHRIERKLRKLASNRFRRYLLRMSLLDPELLQESLRGFEPAMELIENNFYRYFSKVQNSSPLAAVMYVDLKTYLPCDILTKVDIASMANSLEVRVPFLDHRIVEYASGLRTELKIKPGNNKLLLKETMKGLLPEETLHRRKQGFGVPLIHWFRKEFSQFLKDALLSTDSFVRTVLEPSLIRRLMDEHYSKKEDHSYRLWTILILELWARTFISGKGTEPITI